MGSWRLGTAGERWNSSAAPLDLVGAVMPPAEGEATTPAVEAGPEVPEVAVDGEGKAAEAAVPTEQLSVPAEQEAVTTNDEAPRKESEVESVVEVAKESDTKEKDSQPEVEKEDEVKSGEAEEPPVII